MIKADGLAAGKGVFVCRTSDKLDVGLQQATALGGALVSRGAAREGREVSLFALCDGARAAPSRRATGLQADQGRRCRTQYGRYGLIASPVAGFGPAEVEEVLETVHRPVLEELAARGSPFVGVLFAGVMLTDQRDPRVLEFNCRFGDPETQSLLPRVEGNLLGALARSAAGDLSDVELEITDSATVTVVLAAGDYPAASDVGSPIAGIEDAEQEGALVFHAGTALNGDRLVTNGGRILGVTSTGVTVAVARERAYAACERISFAGMRYRNDIAAMAHA